MPSLSSSGGRECELPPKRAYRTSAFGPRRVFRPDRGQSDEPSDPNVLRELLPENTSSVRRDGFLGP